MEGMISSKMLDSLETHSNKLRPERWPIRLRDGKALALFRPIKLKSNTTMNVFHESWQIMRHSIIAGFKLNLNNKQFSISTLWLDIMGLVFFSGLFLVWELQENVVYV